MRDKLIRILGGFTLWDMERVDVEANARLRAFDRELDYLQALVSDRNIEVQRLSDLMFSRAGFLVVEGKLASADKEAPKPINRRQSWPQKQQDLEKADAKKAADKTEAYWKEKQEKANDASQIS